MAKDFKFYERAPKRREPAAVPKERIRRRQGDVGLADTQWLPFVDDCPSASFVVGGMRPTYADAVAAMNAQVEPKHLDALRQYAVMGVSGDWAESLASMVGLVDRRWGYLRFCAAIVVIGTITAYGVDCGRDAAWKLSTPIRRAVEGMIPETGIRWQVVAKKVVSDSSPPSPAFIVTLNPRRVVGMNDKR